jgi:UTP:GlnB (protein PII) uridylyltransferase
VGVDERHRDGLDEADGLVVDLLRHPDILGEGAEALAASRRAQAEALSVEPAATARLRPAPVDYVLAHEPEELARQAWLVEPLPAAKTIRVAVSPDPTADHWLIDVACRDREALLARLCRAITAAGCDIVAATVATWPDGAVVDSFYVRTAVRRKVRALAGEMEEQLTRRLTLEPLPGTTVSFDNSALPWHTAAIATAPDRPGTLAALATAFAASGVAVHSARIGPGDVGLVDRFALSDRNGRKLDHRAMARIEAALAGELPRRFSLRR